MSAPSWVPGNSLAGPALTITAELFDHSNRGAGAEGVGSGAEPQLLQLVDLPACTGDRSEV
jgi:hypothetical protein